LRCLSFIPGNDCCAETLPGGAFQSELPMETKPVKPNPETPNRKLLRLAREIIHRFAAQGKQVTIDDVAQLLFTRVLSVENKEERNDMLLCLAREGCIQFSWSEMEDRRARQADHE
jgi:hypothetical protein